MRRSQLGQDEVAVMVPAASAASGAVAAAPRADRPGLVCDGAVLRAVVAPAAVHELAEDSPCGAAAHVAACDRDAELHLRMPSSDVFAGTRGTGGPLMHWHARVGVRR